MLIDWFTVSAQVINFLILVWLLKRFLYQPILDAIDEREKRIATKIADAEAKEGEAQKQRDVLQQKNEEFDQQHDAHMKEMQQAAKKEREQLLDAARQESEDLRARLQQALTNEQLSLNEELSRRAREEVFAIARKALSDLAATSLEQRMTEIFLDRLRELNDEQKVELKSAFTTSSDPLLIRTAFELPEQQCADIEALIGEMLGKDKQIKFDIVPELVSGIELSSSGHKVAWSIADYLTSLANSVDVLLKANTQTQSRPESMQARDKVANSTQDEKTDGA